MPVVGPNDVENYKYQNDFGFLSLADDGDIAKVRFYIENMDDMKFYIVHKVVDKAGNSRYVDCLRTYDQPLDDCPFCQEGVTSKEFRTQVKMFIPVLDLKDNSVKIFERGRSFKSELEGHIRRNAPLVNYPCEIERKGAKGSTDTVYKVFPLAQEKDDIMIKDLPEQPDLMDGYILNMTFDQMKQFLETRTFPKAENEKEESLPRRTSRQAEDTQTAQTAQPAKRTSSRF